MSSFCPHCDRIARSQSKFNMRCIVNFCMLAENMPCVRATQLQTDCAQAMFGEPGMSDANFTDFRSVTVLDNAPNERIFPDCFKFAPSRRTLATALPHKQA